MTYCGLNFKFEVEYWRYLSGMGLHGSKQHVPQNPDQKNPLLVLRKKIQLNMVLRVVVLTHSSS